MLKSFLLLILLLWANKTASLAYWLAYGCNNIVWHIFCLNSSRINWCEFNFNYFCLFTNRILQGASRDGAEINKQNRRKPKLTASLVRPSLIGQNGEDLICCQIELNLLPLLLLLLTSNLTVGRTDFVLFLRPTTVAELITGIGPSNQITQLYVRVNWFQENVEIGRSL